MDKYLGVKLVDAEPKNLGDYNKFKGWEIPENENPLRDGYIVKYSDNYISWSPKEPFEDSYRILNNLTFGMAIEALKMGKRVARKGWNGKGMWLDYVPTNLYQALNIGNGLLPWIGMKTADNCFVPWLASQTDMLAEDWTILD